MSFTKPVLILLVVFYFVVVNNAYEVCPNNMMYCPYYCCSQGRLLFCCSSCRASYRYHAACYSAMYISYSAIVGIIFSMIFVLVIIGLTISVCCGCVCSSRTGIHRRGRVIPDEEVYNLTVFNAQYQHERVAPPYTVNYQQGNPPAYQTVIHSKWLMHFRGFYFTLWMEDWFWLHVFWCANVRYLVWCLRSVENLYGQK